MQLSSPSQVFHRLVSMLPPGPAAFIWNLSYLFAWISLPYAIIGAVRDLELVMRYGRLLVDLSPDLIAGALIWMRTQIDTMLGIWRAITGPLRQLFFDLGLPIPPEYLDLAADLVTVPLLLVPAIIRFIVQRGIYLAEDVAAALTQSSADLAARRAQEQAAAADAASEDNIVGGAVGGAAAGAVVGGPVGAVIGGILGGLAAAIGSDSDTSQADAEKAEATAQARRQAQRAALAQRRMNQSKLILRVSIGAVIVVLALIVVDWLINGPSFYTA